MRRPLDPTTEVIGLSILSIVENLPKEDIQPFIDKYNLQSIEPLTWYPLSMFLAVLDDIGNTSGGMLNLVAVGMAVTEGLMKEIPPEMKNAPLLTVLGLWDTMYYQQHRNGEIGHVKAEQISPHYIRTYHDHLYPDDLTYGVAYGMAKYFLPPGTHFTVAFDPGTPHIDIGGDITIIDITWQ